MCHSTPASLSLIIIIILTDMTNCIEIFGMRWKEKSLTIVAGVFSEYKPGDTLEIFSERARRTVAEGMG